MRKLAIVGAGSMAEALISGIVKNNLLDSKNIWVTNKTDEKKLKNLHHKYGVTITYDLDSLFNQAETVVLAMKPKDALAAIQKIRGHLTNQMLIISVLAGISVNTIETLAGKSLSIARAMPNTSAAVGKSATAIAVNTFVSSTQLEMIRSLFDTVGLTTFVNEEQLDAVTGLSGSGPAYIYYLVEAMENSAVEIGLERQIAKELIVQTLVGAAEMLKSTTKSSSKLRQEVTSPGGTTEAGIRILEENKVQHAFVSCIKEAASQSKRMGNALSMELHSVKQIF
ncbi:MAG: pyrroline-5-carboxylate reductase [Bacillota bacterium]|nr:pyrroline-5-carboxylate reductase [Bacillota bacterium]